MRKFFTRYFLIALSFIAITAVSGQVNIVPGTTVTQNFDGIGTTNTAALPSGWKVDKPATARVVGMYSAATSATEQVGGANLSTSATNGIYNLGSGTTATGPDRALGAVSSGTATKSANFYVQLKNNSSNAIGSLVLSYDVEKYRKGSNAAGFRMQLYYSADGINWTAANSDFTTSFSADADNTGYTPAPGATVSVNKALPVSIAAGANFYLAWNYAVTTGSTTTNAQALAIDNISILPVANISSDATLSALTVSEGALAPSFAPNTTDYTVSVSNTVSSIIVSPVKSDANATVKVLVNNAVASQPITLQTGNNTIVVNVTAEDNSTVKNYTIVVTKAAAPIPVLSAVPTSLDFGNICTGTESIKSFALSGNALNGTSVHINELPGFSFAEVATGPFTSSLDISYAAASFSNRTVYVKFDPTWVQSYNGDIILNGGGVNNFIIPVSAGGVNTSATANTGAASGVTTSSVVLNGSIGTTGCNAITAYGFEYGTTSGFANGTIVTTNNFSGSNFSASVSSLNSNTTYFYKAFVTTAAGTVYGTQQSFTVKATPVILAEQPYLTYKEDFSGIAAWGSNFTGADANHFSTVALSSTGTIPSAFRVTNSTAYSSGTSGGIQKGSSNIQLLATGGTDNTASTAFDLYLDFTGVNAGTLSFDWASVANSTGDRNGSLRIYASDNGGTSFTELTGAAVLNFTNNVATNGSVSVTLPSSFNNNANARLRFYYYNGVGGITPTGSRPKISIDNLTVSSVSTAACATPVSAPTNLNFANINETTVDISFTAAAPAVTEYLVVVSADSELSSNPVDGEVYSIGDNLGDGFVAAKTNLTSFTVSGLTAGTKYYFFVFPVNSTCVGGPKYLTSNILSEEVITKAALLPCAAPAEQPGNLNLSSTTKLIQGSFTSINASEYLVVRSLGALSALPVNGTNYKAGDAIGNGTVVQRSSAQSFTASGLTANTTYNIYVFSLNNTECLNGPAYNTADPLQSSVATQPLQPCVSPTAQPTNISFNVSNSTVSGTFNGIGGETNYMVIISNNPVLGAAPVNGVDYTAGSAFGSGTVVSVSESTSFTASNLNAASSYYFFVFAVNNNCTGGSEYFATDPLQGTATTSNAPKYNYYFGNLHAHSDYSDGNQDRPGYTPTQDWEYATTALGMDFLGISEHNHFSSANNPGTFISQYHSGVNEAKAFNASHPNFLALYGMEWGVISGGGHVVVYGDDMKELFGWESNVGGTTGNNYDVYVPKNTYIGSTGLFKNINDFIGKNAFATLAHPNSDDYNNLSNIAYNAVADSAIVGTAVESGPSGSTNTTYSNPGSSMSYLWYYQKMLAKGYHLGPVIDHDNHKTTFGKTTPARTAVLATELTSSALVKAIREMRFYSTQDIDAKVDFTVNTRVMGSVFTDRNAPAISVSLSDATTNTSNAIIRIMHGIPGSGTFAVQVDSVIGNSLNFVHADLPVNATGYYYADITNGSARIITSPVWYTRICELTTTLNEKACSSYTWNGETYTVSGVYVKQFRTSGGCDSTVTLNLTINQPTTGDTTAVACDSFTWYGQTFTSSATATHVFTNAAGCDSTVTLHLTINISPKATVAAEGTTIICPSTAVKLTASADQTVSYQWLLNGNVINGATNNEYIAITSGNYSVAVMNANNCSSTSNSIAVTVQDITAPVPDIAELETVNAECSATVNAPTATDDCKAKITATTSDPTTFNTQGTYIIHWKYDDGNGNISTQDQTVIINDVTNPVIACAPSQFFCYNTSGNYTIPVLNATDNCGIVSVSYTITGATQRSGNGYNASGSFNMGISTITWIVTDVNGNSTSCATQVTVNTPVIATIADVAAVFPGGSLNTLYLGYGPTSVSLTATVNGGTPGYTYSWSNGSSTAFTSVTVAAGTLTYTVTATDTKGCFSSASKTIFVTDVRSGNKQDKVAVCHKGNTLSISKEGVADHLQHGDALGSCPVTIAARSTAKVVGPHVPDGSVNVTVSPVPNKGAFSVNLNNYKAGAAEIRITDNNGKLVATRKIMISGKASKFDFNLTNLAQGVYNVTVIAAGNKENVRMTVTR